MGAISKDMREKLIDDMAGLLGSLAGLVNDTRIQVKSGLRRTTKDCGVRSGLSTRDDTDRLRERVDDLEARIAALEKKKK